MRNPTRFASDRPDTAARIEPLESRMFLSAGSLDPAFNHGQPLTVADSVPMAISVLNTERLSDGKILLVGVVGDTVNANDESLVLQRRNADGSLDTSFGERGSRLVPQVDNALQVAFDPRGRALVLDPSYIYGGIVVRIGLDGQIDTTFANQGTLNFSRLTEKIAMQVEELGVRPDGEIILAGSSNYGDGATLIAYRPDGRLDKSFGIRGLAYGVRRQASNPNAIAFGRDGRIILAAFGPSGGQLQEFSPSGKVNQNFGRGGIVDIPDPAAAAGTTPNIDDLTVSTDGEIYVVGGDDVYYPPARGLPLIIAAIRPNGQLDSRFGSNGIVQQTIGHRTYNIVPSSISIDGGNLIVRGGIITAGNSGAAFIERLNRTNGSVVQSNGSPFTLIPSVNTAQGPLTSAAYKPIAEPDGSLLVPLFAATPLLAFYPNLDSDPGPSLARLMPNGQLDTSWNQNGLLTAKVPIGAPISLIAADGNQAGLYVTTSVAEDTQTTITKLTASGKIDRAFSHQGRMLLSGSPTLAFLSTGEFIVPQASGTQEVLTLHNPDGSVDTSFASGGQLTVPTVAAASGHTYSNIFRRSDGNLLIDAVTDTAGPTMYSTARSQQLLLVSPTGQILASRTLAPQVTGPFEGPHSAALTPSGGVVIYDAGLGVQRFNADLSPYITVSPGNGGLGTMQVQPDGGIVAVTYSQHYPLIRFNPDGSLDTTFAGSGSLQPLGQGFDSFVIQSDGRIITAQPRGNDFLISRYDSDGSPDISFGRHGRILLAVGVPNSEFNMAIQQTSAGQYLIVSVTAKTPGSPFPTGLTEAVIAKIDLQ